MAARNPFKLKQVSVRLVNSPPLYSTEPVTSPEAAIRVMANELKDLDREVVAIVNLKTNMQPINFSIASMGSLNGSICHPRDLLKNVFLSNANGIIMIHNHPSGSLIPSKEDIQMTDRMNHICSMADITLYDHIIIGAGNVSRYFSMKEKGEMSFEAVRFTQDINALHWTEPTAAEVKSDYPEKKESVLGELKEKQKAVPPKTKSKACSKCQEL